jgi:hypothetical protein
MEGSKYKSVYTEAARLEKLCNEQSTALAAKDVRIAELEKALQPFKERLEAYLIIYDDSQLSSLHAAGVEPHVSFNDLRAAKATLSQKGGE